MSDKKIHQVNGYIVEPADTVKRSEEVEDIIGVVPHWILRAGILSLTGIIVCIALATYYIKYPDTLKADVVLTAYNPPANVVAKATGKLKKLYVNDNNMVKAGQLIAELESNASADSVALLKNYVLKANLNNKQKLFELSTHSISTTGLGELRVPCDVFYQALQNYVTVWTDKSIEKKIANIEQQEKLQHNLRNVYVLTDELSYDKLNLEEQKYEADKYLAENKVSSDMEFVEAKKKLIDSKLAYENIKTTLINNQISIEQLTQMVITLRQEDEQRKLLATNKLNDTYNKLYNEIENWEQKYLLCTPKAGKVTFTKYWTNNQDVNTGDVVFTIVPDSQYIFARATVPIYKSAKMKIGQPVHVKLANYPYEQYGMLNGEVTNISTVPMQDNYLITIHFKKGMVTSYNKTLRYYPEMKASGEVIIEEERLIRKLFSGLALFK